MKKKKNFCLHDEVYTPKDILTVLDVEITKGKNSLISPAASTSKPLHSTGTVTNILHTHNIVSWA